MSESNGSGDVAVRVTPTSTNLVIERAVLHIAQALDVKFWCY